MATSGLRAIPSADEGTDDRDSPVVAFCSRHYAVLATTVLGLAAVNLGFRLGTSE